MATQPQSPQSRRTQRLEARVTAEEKRLFALAAELSGRSLSDFMVASLRDAAEAAIRERQTMLLSPADMFSFVSALIDPPAPNDALRRAAGRYREGTPAGLA